MVPVLNVAVYTGALPALNAVDGQPLVPTPDYCDRTPQLSIVAHE